MSIKSHTNPTSSFSPAGSWMRAWIYLVFILVILLPALPVRADQKNLPEMQEEQPEGYWQLTGSDESSTWQGDKFHGMDSEYSPNIGENSLGATYTQYNIRFNNTAPQTIASSLNGTCTWEWGEGDIPDKIKSGTAYPFNMRASANYEGSLLLGSTVNAYTQIREGSVAFAQAYLNVDGSNTSDSKTVSASLNFPAGQSDGEGRSVTLMCQIDIVTVQRVYTYQWKETSCSATLTLPTEMLPDKEFTPQVSVVDMDNQTVKPDKETWYYNEAASPLPMKWDGKEAAVKYEYICPGGSQTRTASVTIPKAASCTAALALPEKMVPDELFTTILSVVGSDQKPVTPVSETWYYNDVESSQTMKWDGKQAMVRYDYVCPNETETKTVSVTIPPAKTCSAAIVLPDKMEADKEFTPRADVVNKAEGTPVIPQEEKWYLNGALSVLPMKWDGKAAEVKYEYKCPLDSQTLTAEKSIPPVPGSDFILVVGGLAAVAAAGLAAAGAGAVALKGGTKPDLPERYILQVDKNYLEVKAKLDTPLFIQVWKIKSDGSTVPASDAPILVELPSDNSGLAAYPGRGTGSLTCMFSVPHPRECADVPVTVSATAGLLKKSAQVTVRIVPLYELELSWLDPSNNRLQPGGAEIYAVATLEATPRPDARTTADDLAERIALSLDGPNSSLVRLSTTAGQKPYVNGGKLWIPLSVPALPQGASLEAGNPVLTASFTDGNQRVEAQLPLEISGEFVLGAWVLGKKMADVIFDAHGDTPHWMVPEIVTYFHDLLDDSTPVHPGFDYTFDHSSVKFDPDVMTVKEIYSQDKDQYTIVCELNSTAELEDAFGENLEKLNGLIKVSITPLASTEKPINAKVTYQLRPQFELFATQGDEMEREYKGAPLQKYELVVDGDDEMVLYIGVCRTDKCIDRFTNPENDLDPVLWTYKQFFKGGHSKEFTVNEPEEASPDEVPTLTVKSVKPRLYNPGSRDEKLSLHLEGSLGSGAPAHYQGNLGDYDLELKPVFPNLKLWVVPGRQRGESEAWMLAYLGNDPKRRLPETILNVKVESLGTGKLLTPDGDDTSDVITGPEGTEQVYLFYSGLNWSNYREAVFRVSACITNRSGDQKSEEVDDSFSVGDNVKSLLSDLMDRADMLKLNNPYYTTERSGRWGDAIDVTEFLSLTSIRPVLRGPLWNTILSVSRFVATIKQNPTLMDAWKDTKKRNLPSFKWMGEYVCSEFRDRIAEWLITRRHYRRGSLQSMDTVKKMNGIEFDHFTIGGVHNYEALFLSGMDPEADPRATDPWWKQQWNDPAYLDPDGLITTNWERLYSTETAAWLHVSILAICLLFGISGGILLATVTTLLGPTIAVYATATAGELGSKWEMGTAYEGGSYKFNRADNIYAARKLFIDEWAADQGA